MTYNPTPILPQLTAQSEGILRTGCWPMLAPAPRDWSVIKTPITFPGVSLPWPPKNWQQLDPDSKQGAFSHMAYSLEIARLGGHPTEDPATVADRYNFLALPGQARTPPPTDSACFSEYMLRRYFYEVIKDHEDKKSGRAALFTTPLLGNEKFDDDYVRRCVDLLGDLPLSPLWHLPILTEEKKGEKPKKKQERAVPYTPSAPSY